MLLLRSPINFQNGDTALTIAAALDKKSIVKKLLQWGADPSVRNHVRTLLKDYPFTIVELTSIYCVNFMNKQKFT